MVFKLELRPLGRKDIKKIEAQMSHEGLYQTWPNAQHL